MFVVLGAGFVAEGVMVKTLKHEFAYPRPYIALEQVRVLEYNNTVDTGDDYKSFPSGHASFATLLLVGLWPVISKGFRWIGVVLLAGVCWSRMALGVHFPADVLGGVLITLLLVLIIRAIIYSLLLKLNIRC